MDTNEDLYQFLVCDYFATGEGRSIMLLITRAYPTANDYEIPPDFERSAEGKMVYYPGKLKYSKKFIAAREFVEEFGAYYAQGAENLPREDFITKWGSFLPEPVLKMLTSENQPGNLNFKQSFHFNYA